MKSAFVTRQLSVTAVMLCCAGSARPEDWYRWRGPRLDGVSIETDWDPQRITDSNAQRWRTNVGIGFSSVVIKDGRLFTLGNQDDTDTIVCLDADSGDLIWESSYPSPLDAREFEGGPTATPTADDDRLYTLSREGDLFCLEAGSGKEIWKQQIVDLTGIRIPGWGFAASPLISGRTLLVNAGDAGIALDKMTGELIWQSADKDCGYGGPVLISRDGETIAVIPSGRSYVAVQLDSGAEKWRQRWLTSFGCNAADPIVMGDRVFLSSGYNRGAALLDTSGAEPEIIWKNKLMRNQVSASVLIDGLLYGVDGDVDNQPALTCLEFNTGNLQWSDKELLPGAITATRDRLIVLTKSGDLVIGRPSPEGFDEQARVSVFEGRCLTVPVLSNGRIYCRDASGELVCVDVSPRE